MQRKCFTTIDLLYSIRKTTLIESDYISDREMVKVLIHMQEQPVQQMRFHFICYTTAKVNHGWEVLGIRQGSV